MRCTNVDEQDEFQTVELSIQIDRRHQRRAAQGILKWREAGETSAPMELPNTDNMAGAPRLAQHFNVSLSHVHGQWSDNHSIVDNTPGYDSLEACRQDERAGRQAVTDHHDGHVSCRIGEALGAQL